MKTGILTLLIWLIFFIGSIASWSANLYKLTQCDFNPSYKAEIIYGVGVFTPTFYITAWMDLE